MEAAITITGPKTFGKICLTIILISFMPNAFAACIYSISLNAITCPRISLATETHIVNPTAIKICQKPLPNTSVIPKTNNKVGMLQITFMSHIIILSVFPPKYPAREPRITPMVREINTVIKPTARLTLTPTINRLKISLPNLSVPNQKVFETI